LLFRKASAESALNASASFLRRCSAAQFFLARLSFFFETRLQRGETAKRDLSQVFEFQLRKARAVGLPYRETLDQRRAFGLTFGRPRSNSYLSFVLVMNQRETVPTTSPMASIDTGKTISMARDSITDHKKSSYPSSCLRRRVLTPISCALRLLAKTGFVLLCLFVAICRSSRPCVRRLCA
jgi:hypothetical protein